MDQHRTVLAFGGNAIAPDGAGTAAQQTERLWATMRQVAELVAEGRTAVVLTHGNGPQVGNVLIKNELARHVVPPVPLDWCVAQTQATIGFTIAGTLTYELDRRGLARPVVPVVSRVLVAADDPGFDDPTKPIGPWLHDGDEVRRREAEGLAFLHDAERGWRRLVASPAPVRSVDRAAVELLLDDGAIVVANGGGGIPVVDAGDGPLQGIEAVIDKDRSAAMLAEEIDADTLCILTDVTGVAVDYGTADERWLAEVSVDDLRALAAAGQFGAGSMGPKVEAACQFVERTGRRAAIGSLDDLVDVVHGTAGTQVVPEAAS